MNIIETIHLTRTFGDLVAVDDVDIHVGSGEIYGFLGLNGAGKTTTIRLMLGMIRADSGAVKLFGQQLRQASPVWNDIGYLVETPRAYPDITVRENLKVIARLRGLKDGDIDAVIERLQLNRYRDVPAKNLSAGNRQRLGLAKALIHRPALLILDEPINGLDPAGIVEVRDFLKELTQNHGTTIFLSSHILSEIARLASRIGIVHNGRLIREISSADFEKEIIRKVRVQTNDNRAALACLNGKGYAFTWGENGFIESSAEAVLQQPEAVATVLVQADLPPRSLNLFEEDLETYFLRMIGMT